MSATDKRPGIPPLVLVALLGLAMWLAAGMLPRLGFPMPWRHAVSAAILAAGVALCVAGLVPFRRARTTVDPTRPDRTSALVTGGVYAWTRNPMYLGFLLALVAWGVYLANVASLLLAPPAFVAYLDRFQIPTEERALSRTFGEAYAAYARCVRRWI